MSQDKVGVTDHVTRMITIPVSVPRDLNTKIYVCINRQYIHKLITYLGLVFLLLSADLQHCRKLLCLVVIEINRESYAGNCYGSH